jgi:hypothetical protein
LDDEGALVISRDTSFPGLHAAAGHANALSVPREALSGCLERWLAEAWKVGVDESISKARYTPLPRC